MEVNSEKKKLTDDELLDLLFGHEPFSGYKQTTAVMETYEHIERIYWRALASLCPVWTYTTTATVEKRKVTR